ncbi:MAG: hypothetical protein RIF39_06360 [Cyclobacteriaceae bacterium]
MAFKKALEIIGILIFLSTNAYSFKVYEPADSSKKVTFVITPRINSTGHFPFTGSLINHHLNADINIFYEKKSLGFFLFKSQDLQEKSFVNYLQPGLFATARLNQSLRARVFVGYLFSQAESFRDADSDYYSALSIYWNVAPRLRVENTSLFYDLQQQVKLADRLVVTWESQSIKLDLYVWHRIVMEENNHATSAMLAMTFPKIKISNSTSLLFISSYQRYLTTNRPSFALKDGFLFSLLLPIEP